jgi:hypothetical protein
MNRRELGQRLRDEAFRADCFSIDGTLPPYEGYVLTEVGGVWLVQYFERGETRELARFLSEAEACADFYERLAKDAAVRPRGNARGK